MNDAFATMTIAACIARKAVQAAWRDAGIKTSHVPVAKLNREAKVWIAEHPEVFEEARARCAELNIFTQRRKR